MSERPITQSTTSLEALIISQKFVICRKKRWNTETKTKTWSLKTKVKTLDCEDQDGKNWVSKDLKSKSQEL